MQCQPTWQEGDGCHRLGGARAEQFVEPEVFVIRTFGPGADADKAFECICEALRFGLIAIEGEEQNRVLARQLAADGRVKFTPFVGLPFDAFAVAAVKAAAVRARA